jgi:hypothetical protein
LDRVRGRGEADTAWTIIHVLFLAGVERRGHAEIKMSPLVDAADQKS